MIQRLHHHVLEITLPLISYHKTHRITNLFIMNSFQVDVSLWCCVVHCVDYLYI